MKLSRLSLWASLILFLYITRQPSFLFPIGDSESRLLIKGIVDKVLEETALTLIFSGDLFGRTIPKVDLTKLLAHQTSLSCSLHGGQWHLRSNQPVFFPRQDCFSTWRIPANFSIRICTLLAGKKIIFVGPETTYYLHSLWLNSLENYEGRPHNCLGQAYCVFHHICRSPVNGSEVDLDMLVGRKKKIPSSLMLSSTKSSLLHYVLSTTLHASDNQHDPAYILPVIDSRTGVRSHNNYWLRRARKADIIVMNRGPLPAPAWSYDSKHRSGNWTFVDDLWYKHSPSYLDTEVVADSFEIRLINAALHATISRFLPSVIRSLRVIGEDPGIQNSLLIWHGSWFLQSSCTKAGQPEGISSSREFWEVNNRNALIDPWSFYYNAQGASNFYLRFITRLSIICFIHPSL
ncbi:hypothetical protein BYT27DRAFT_7157564 [Phlegmacium glaucopus]|nr:hypothetical protein BYT27DRAFT_7157564 [Phlegmacium glaucopus]